MNFIKNLSTDSRIFEDEEDIRSLGGSRKAVAILVLFCIAVIIILLCLALVGFIGYAM